MHTVQSTIHTEYKYKSIIVLNAKGKEMRNKCCGLLLEIRKSLIRKGMLVLRVKEEVVVHIKYQYVNILHGGGDQTLLDILFLPPSLEYLRLNLSQENS